jgi:putative membrane protein
MVAFTAHVALPVALAFAVLGCGSDSPAKSPDIGEAPPPPLSGAIGAPSSGGPAVASIPPAADPPPVTVLGASSTPAVATAESTPVLTDPQILRVLQSANASEIAQAKLAVARAKDVRVKKLAALMLDTHTKAEKKWAALAKKAGLTPEPSTVSAAVESDAGLSTSALQADSGDDFDRAYVASQVKQHRAALDLIDGKLIPNARNTDLATLLATVRPTVELHLQNALDLQGAMQK